MVDASASVGNIHDAQSTYIKEFATLLSGDFNKPVANQWGSPISQHYQTRMGLVTFFGPCITCANTCSNPLASTPLSRSSRCAAQVQMLPTSGPSMGRSTRGAERPDSPVFAAVCSMSGTGSLYEAQPSLPLFSSRTDGRRPAATHRRPWRLQRS